MKDFKKVEEQIRAQIALSFTQEQQKAESQIKKMKIDVQLVNDTMAKQEELIKVLEIRLEGLLDLKTSLLSDYMAKEEERLKAMIKEHTADMLLKQERKIGSELKTITDHQNRWGQTLKQLESGVEQAQKDIYQLKGRDLLCLMLFLLQYLKPLSFRIGMKR